MSDRRKLGPIRQLSLQSDVKSRPILKKQLSVEHLDTIDEQRIRIRGVESAKNKLSDRPRPVKVAWAETKQQSKDESLPPRSPKFSDPVEVKKCKEFKRPTLTKLRSQSCIDKESILYTRQELAEKLRRAWQNREESKHNLDIFLTHNKSLDEDFEECNEYEKYIDVCIKQEDNTCVSINSDELINNFQNKSRHKSLLKVRSNSVSSEFSYVPSTTASKPQDVRTNISVTIPSVFQNLKLPSQDSVESNKNENKCAENTNITTSISDVTNQNEKEPDRKEPKLVKQMSLINKENESVIKNLPPRPMTAAAKREGFQKRTNTAFNGSLTTSEKDFRPPLTRNLSVPVKSDKPKLFATKRRLKSSRKKPKDDENSADELDKNGEKVKTKKGSRCKSAPTGELVTMVSLVSPAGSDTEEQVDGKKSDEKHINASPVKTTSILGNQDSNKTTRKIVKSVSFQQSSIHTVRSFSASFPSRREMSAALQAVSLAAEKRAPLENFPSPTENRAPKRRLLRTTSVTIEEHNVSRTPERGHSFDEDTTKDRSEPILLRQPSEILGVTKAELSPISSLLKLADEKSKDKEGTLIKQEKEEENTDDPETPKFKSNKEKECWIMYKKMNDKGLPVSFDTILRGMLTPSEYRSARKEVIASTS